MEGVNPTPGVGSESGIQVGKTYRDLDPRRLGRVVTVLEVRDGFAIAKSSTLDQLVRINVNRLRRISAKKGYELIP